MTSDGLLLQRTRRMAGDRRRDDDTAKPGSLSDAELAARFDRLSRSLDHERAERLEAERPAARSAAGYGQAFRLASEFVAGVVVGAGLGWGLDRVAGTSPWGLIVLLLLGFAAGVLNVMRAASRMSAPAGGAGDGSSGG